MPALQHNMCVDADKNSRVQCQIWQKYQKVENEEKRNFVKNHLQLVRHIFCKKHLLTNHILTVMLSFCSLVFTDS